MSTVKELRDALSTFTDDAIVIIQIFSVGFPINDDEVYIPESEYEKIKTYHIECLTGPTADDNTGDDVTIDCYTELNETERG